MEVPMHQDGNYWPIRPLATCTAWIAIDESSLENGCMTVLPGSHRDCISYKHRKDERENLVINQKVDDERVRFEQCIPLELLIPDVFLFMTSTSSMDLLLIPQAGEEQKWPFVICLPTACLTGTLKK